MTTAPGPGTLRMLGHLIKAKGDVPTVMEALSAKYGDVVKAKLGPSSFHLVVHPDDIQNVLVERDLGYERVKGERRVSARLVDQGLFVTEGQAHLDRRKVMESVMYEGAPSHLGSSIAEVASRVREELVAGRPMDLFAWTEKTATRVMVKLLFGLDETSVEGHQMADAIDSSIRAMDSMPAAFSGVPERFRWARRRFEAVRSRLDHLVFEQIAKHRSEADNDILNMLLAEGSLTDQELRDELLTLFRGHQAVSSALCWTFFQLATLPKIEDELHSEIDALGEAAPAYEDLPKLQFTRKVFQESLRMYPPAYVLARLAVEHHDLRGVTIPAGSQVMVGTWVAHRDPRFWSDPMRFDPHRFDDDQMANRHAFAFFPQGAGTKMCMGKHLVQPIEGPLLLASIAQRWSFQLDPSRPIRTSAKATLKPKGGAWMVPNSR